MYTGHGVGHLWSEKSREISGISPGISRSSWGRPGTSK